MPYSERFYFGFRPAPQMPCNRCQKVGQLLLLLILSLLVASCLSKSIRIEQHQISTASFSCTSINKCWAFSDGDAHSHNSGMRRGFLELHEREWKRKEIWGSWYDATEEGRPSGMSTSLSFCNENIGWIAINGQLFKRVPKPIFDWSDDPNYSSAEWSFVSNPFSHKILESGTVKEVYFLNRQMGWIFSQGKKIALTNDGGLQWDTYRIGFSDSYSSLYFLDSLRGWVVSKEQKLLQTQDGGKSWEQVALISVPGIIKQIHIGESNQGWMVLEGTSSLYKTEDGGRTWGPSIGGSDKVQSIYYLDYLHGWGIKHGTGIVHTSNGGKSWEQQEVSNYWHEHPVNLIWKVPGWIVGGLFVAIASIPDLIKDVAVGIGASS